MYSDSELIKAEMYVAQVSSEAAFGDVYEGPEAELGDHELLAGEELGGEAVVEGLLDGFAGDAEVAQLGGGEMPCYPVEDLCWDLEETAGLDVLAGSHVCGLLRHGGHCQLISR